MLPPPVSPAWAESAFQWVNGLVLPGWWILFFAPRWRFGAWLVSGVLIPSLLAIAYLVLVVISMNMPESVGPEAFLSLAGVMTLFDNPVGVVAGWTHYLVFDLAIGSWQVRDSAKNGIPHKWVIPCLFFTLMLGPVGFLMYLGLRSWRMKQIGLGV